MSILARPAPKPSVAPLPESGISGTIVLHSVPWSVYEALRDEEANNHVRMTYDGGRLELMAPARRHERVHLLLARLAQTWTEENSIPLSSGGQTTLRRKDLSRGAEPDASFHIQYEADVRGVDDLRLPDHPPPDLVIEADVTSTSIPRLPIFAAIGVPEVWRWRNGTFEVLHLDGGDYAAQPVSRVLPGFPITEAQRLLDRRNDLGETELARMFRDVVRGIVEGKS